MEYYRFEPCEYSWCFLDCWYYSLVQCNYEKVDFIPHFFLFLRLTEQYRPLSLVDQYVQIHTQRWNFPDLLPIVVENGTTLSRGIYRSPPCNEQCPMLFGYAVSVWSDDDRSRLNTARRRRWSSEQNCAILALPLDQPDGKRTDPWDDGKVGLFRSVALDWPHSMSQLSHPTTGENVTTGVRCSIRVTTVKVLLYIYYEQQSFPWMLNRVQCSERVSASTAHRHWWSKTIVRANSSALSRSAFPNMQSIELSQWSQHWRI